MTTFTPVKRDIDGYMKNAKGALIPIENVKAIDKLRDQLVKDLTAKARELQATMIEFKQAFSEDITSFVETSAEEHNHLWGGKKGNVSLRSFDGSLKVEVSIQDYLSFNEKIHVAKAKIDELLHEWTAESRSEIRALIDQAFNVDKAGNLSTARILGLRKVDIDDARWKEAMDIISESVEVMGSKPYLRFYEQDENGKYQNISLDFSGV